MLVCGETGARDEGVRHLTSAVERAAEPDRNLAWLPLVMLLARAAAAFDDEDAARKLAPLIEPYPGRFSIVLSATCGPTDLGLGLVYAAQERYGEAEAAFVRSEELCERESAVGWLARTRAHRARALLRRGRPGDADLVQSLTDAAIATAEERGVADVVRLLEQTT